jgi:hypothetical protein
VNERLRANLLPAEGSRAETFRPPHEGRPSVVLCCHASEEERPLLLESAPTFASAAQLHGWTLVLSCEPSIDETALVDELATRFDHVLTVNADSVIVDPEFDPLVDSAAGWGAAVERFSDGAPATRATAIAVRRDAVIAEFPARFERLRSPAAAGVDLGPRRQVAAVAARTLEEMSPEELRAIVRELDSADDAHRYRVRELLDQSEVAVYEQVRVERRTGELVDQIQRLEAELSAMQNSKLFRTVAPLRRVYAKLRGHGG